MGQYAERRLRRGLPILNVLPPAEMGLGRAWSIIAHPGESVCVLAIEQEERGGGARPGLGEG